MEGIEDIIVADSVREDVIIRGSNVGVGDRGSEVKVRRSNIDMVEGIEMEGIEDTVVADSVSEDVNMNVGYLSPLKIIQTTHIVVGSNDMEVVSKDMTLIVDEPKEGMVFPSSEDVEAYYKEYAEQMGFGVSRVQGVNYKKDKKQRIAYTWKCECWGKPDMGARREAKKREKAMGVGGSGGLVDGVVCEDQLRRMKRTSKKYEWEARVYDRRNEDGLLVLKTVHLKHNHKIDQANFKLVKEYRMKHLTPSLQRKLLDYYDLGVTISQIHGCMATKRKGVENMRLIVKDLQHEVYKARQLKMVGGDSVAMMEFFEKMQSDNQNIFHAQRLDKEGRLKDVMWVDARSRVACEDFGDVVCFDATYLTNEYEFPFANSVGVNHHGQSLLLGCALVSYEDCDTFRWIFQ
ncbi:protein FAR-RED IMPAIRED RESPONSE 1-like [Chenopodium quinoa]|uniref:protein FAR-RED IMPAIRED RESPONSE 1-like n=1 Tax=Chenopodium quinoa TaxID=63459 RepID=UPI000B7925CE|nr:protein FAR-RED IMPAIRED RESPONSE 1-like [Chenopodium quinoa]